MSISFETVVGSSGHITGKQKARLVARYFEQMHGVDYGETFSPDVKFTYTFKSHLCLSVISIISRTITS